MAAKYVVSVLYRCLLAQSGVDCYEKDSIYKGNKSVTFTGLTCQRWDQQTPNKHAHTDHPDAEENYCRMINDERPWCYTIEPGVRWEYCMVPDCGTQNNSMS